MEKIGDPIKGIYRDVLVGPDDAVIEDSGWVSNTIVTTCRTLLARLMKNESVGIQYLAVGAGDATWDETDTPSPGVDTAALTNGYEPPIAVADMTLVYLDEYDTQVDVPTNRLQITAELEPGYPPPAEGQSTYPLREFGLFGGQGDGEFMINCVRHAVIHKDKAATLIRTIRLYF